MIGQRRYLPPDPNLDQLKHQAKDLHASAAARDERALQRMRDYLPRLAAAPYAAVRDERFTLAEAQLVVAREYGFRSWPRLVEHVRGTHGNTQAPAAAGLDATTSAFFAAVRARDVAAIDRMLVEHPALVDARCPGDNRLLGVVWTDHNRAEPVPPGDPRSSTALHHAAVNGMADVAATLLAHGMDPDVGGYDNNHAFTVPIVLAAWEGNVATVRVLLEGGADPNLDPSHVCTAIVTAAGHGRGDKVALLLAHGAQPGIHTAARLGMVERVEQLLAADPGLAARADAWGQTPLDRAADAGQRGAAEVLRRHGAAVTPRVAAALGMMDVLRAAVDAEPTIVRRDLLLSAAAAGGHVEAIRFLLERGADPNEADRDGARPLHRVAASAVRPASAASVAPLVAAGAELHLIHRGAAPLYRAIRAGNEPAAVALVEAGADVNQKGWDGTPLSAATAAGLDAIAELLRRRGAVE